MEVILTHEQADFDALASLLCVYLLNDQSQPVLPNRVNHNVKNFLNLYGADFSFIEARDMPHQPIRQVNLVDTQSLITLRGISGKTAVRVIDHHDPKPDLPENWQIQVDKVGATTTMLVERLQEINPPLAVMEATLLLLGIYEDTGSLAYASTSVRDVRAAAWLLEKSASLRIAADFLNPALSEGQKALADRLLENVRSVTVNGKSVVLSTAEALDLNEEISTIAHKLRDLLDPDALFLFVHTQEGIRLVARSTSDQVDVSSVARHFGGGGHERASAALIQVQDIQQVPGLLEKLTTDLLKQLRKSITPALTVSKIMSRKPHVISPGTPLDEANRLMQRYGYEGYPVVENERVVGLLTRRAVDRAIQHKLKLTAGSLMEAGEHTIKSSDTIDDLQQLMAGTGWGQIPVVDGDTGKIIGIVTRTDLLKALPGHNGSVSGQKNYSSLLEKALPSSRLALIRLIANFSGGDRQAIYIVGGFVRDLLLERPSLDFDIVVEGDALPFVHALADHFGGRVVTHKRFSTAKWQIKNIHSSLRAFLGVKNEDTIDLPESVDFISARTEFYDHPTALPTVERSSIKLDLHRRDFTINTLALRLDGQHYGELYDFWGGLADLERGLVRVLHSLSFVDDPTRLLRAVRFEQRFGFLIEPRTLQLMKEACEQLRQLSGERIRHEFDLIFNEIDPLAGLRRMEELDLLTHIHPGLHWKPAQEKIYAEVVNYAQHTDWKIPTLVGNVPVRDALIYISWLASLDAAAAAEICQRLRLSRPICETLEKVVALLQHADSLREMLPSQLTGKLDKLPLYGVYSLYCCLGDKTLKAKIHQYATRWRLISPGIDGNTLRERGIPPGPKYALILSHIRNAWLDGSIHTTEEELQLFNQLLDRPEKSDGD